MYASEDVLREESFKSDDAEFEKMQFRVSIPHDQCVHFQ